MTKTVTCSYTEIRLEAAEAAFLAAMHRQRIQVTMERRTAATTARPPREIPVVMVKPPSCWLVSCTKVLMSAWAEETA